MINEIKIGNFYVNHRCEELLGENCWWRNKYFNCCNIIFEQRSTRGICYAFNSATNLIGRQRRVFHRLYV